MDTEGRIWKQKGCILPTKQAGNLCKASINCYVGEMRQNVSWVGGNGTFAINGGYHCFAIMLADFEGGLE